MGSRRSIAWRHRIFVSYVKVNTSISLELSPIIFLQQKIKTLSESMVSNRLLEEFLAGLPILNWSSVKLSKKFSVSLSMVSCKVNFTVLLDAYQANFGVKQNVFWCWVYYFLTSINMANDTVYILIPQVFRYFISSELILLFLLICFWQSNFSSNYFIIYLSLSVQLYALAMLFILLVSIVYLAWSSAF